MATKVQPNNHGPSSSTTKADNTQTGCLNGKTVVRIAKGTVITGIIGAVAFAALKWAPVWVPTMIALGPIGWVATAVVGGVLLCALAMIAMVEAEPRDEASLNKKFAEEYTKLYNAPTKSRHFIQNHPILTHELNPARYILLGASALIRNIIGSNESRIERLENIFKKFSPPRREKVIQATTDNQASGSLRMLHKNKMKIENLSLHSVSQSDSDLESNSD